jgi:hypothetical protein
MNIVMKLLVFIIGSLLGVLILKYRERIVYTIGKSAWAEQKLGMGGTYAMWQLIALGIIVLSFLAAVFS